MSKLKQLLFSLNDTDRKTIEEKLKEKDQQIDQLKQQNEELMLQLSKYEIEKHKPAYCTLAGTECEYLGNVHELKQQLEEKDKEIEKIKTKQKPIVMHSKENYYFLEEENIKLHFAQKQLAITELEKVHAMLVSKAREVVGTGVVAVRLYTINEVINQQIKDLKGEK